MEEEYARKGEEEMDIHFCGGRKRRKQEEKDIHFFGGRKQEEKDIHFFGGRKRKKTQEKYTNFYLISSILFNEELECE